MPRMPKLNIQEFEDMFDFEKSQEPETIQDGITEMELQRMEPFPNHRFKLYEG